MIDQKTNNPRIVLVAGIILTTMTLMASLVTFYIMEKNAELLQGKSLQVALASRALLIETEIGAAFDATVLIANRPLLGDHLILTAAIEDDIVAQNQLNQIGLSFVQEGVQAIAFYDQNGTRLTSSGIFSEQPKLLLPLVNFPATVRIIWDGKLLLRSAVEIQKNGQVIGKLVTESPLPVTMSSIRNAQSLGETGELAICLPIPGLAKMKCLPTTLNPNVFTVPYQSFEGTPIPMVHALEGKSGFIITQDYRNQMVTAAYGPIGDSGMGIVLKVDRAELHSTIWSQLRYVIPLTLILIITSLLLLRWKLNPLVSNLVRAESLLLRQNHHISEANKELEFQKKTMDEHAIVSITDVRGVIIYVNDKFCQVSGYSRKELLGQNHRIMKSNEHSPELFAGMWQTITNGTSWHGELKDHKKDGDYYWAQATIVPFLDKQGNPIKYVSVRTDITARKDAERASRVFEKTLDLSTDSIRMFWPDTLKYFYSNQASLNAVGLTKEQFIGSTPFSNSFNLNEKQFRKLCDTLVIGERKSTSYELDYVNKNGDLINVEVFLQHITPDGERPRFVAISHDIAQRKRAEALIIANEQVERSKQVQSQFLSQMSHELRTPLHAVIGLSKVLVSDTVDLSREKQNEYLGAIQDSGQHLLQLIGDILDLSKLNSDARILEKQPLTITELMEACRSTFNFLCHDKGISLVIDNQFPEAHTVLGDITALKQILFNLLSNAVKFTDHGTITLTMATSTVNGSKPHPSIAFVVSDTGKGISTEAIPMLFNRFTQEDSSITRSFGGSGLGLSISQNLANLMDGYITCKSNLGIGSTFEFIVNLEPQDKSIERPANNHSEAYKLPPLKLLLVDDVALNLIVGVALLEPKGHTVATATSGQQALEMASNNDYDVILMDVHMPGMNGMDATRAIRRLPNMQRSSVCIVALSADVEVEHQAAFLTSGMNAALSKSVLAKGFDKELQRILKLNH